MAKKGGVRGVINELLRLGFTPTQLADSFAIASGGATFYRNRIKSLKKQGMTDAEAEAQACKEVYCVSKGGWVGNNWKRYWNLAVTRHDIVADSLSKPVIPSVGLSRPPNLAGPPKWL